MNVHGMRDNGIIAITLVFGPEHGRTFVWRGQLPDPMMVPTYEPPRFEPYEPGEPYHIRSSTHRYILHDTFDQGVEECAIYFHHEDCCEKDYSTSEPFQEFTYKQGRQVSQPDYPPSQQRKIPEPKPRFAGKSTEYVKAVQAMDDLLKREKDNG